MGLAYGLAHLLAPVATLSMVMGRARAERYVATVRSGSGPRAVAARIHVWGAAVLGLLFGGALILLAIVQG